MIFINVELHYHLVSRIRLSKDVEETVLEGLGGLELAQVCAQVQAVTEKAGRKDGDTLDVREETSLTRLKMSQRTLKMVLIHFSPP